MGHFLVAENYELSKSTSHHLSVPCLSLECLRILSWSISFFSTLIISLIMFCVRLLSELMILLSSHHVTNHLTRCNKFMNCNLILKIKVFWKIFLFFTSCILFLLSQDLVFNLSIQAQPLKVVIQNYTLFL